MGRFQGQMPHWLGLKSPNFHNLSGIDERIVEEIFGSQSTAQGLNSPDQNYATMHPMDAKSLCTCAGDFIYFRRIRQDRALSAWLMLFCAERFISVVCLFSIILRRDN